MPSPRSATCSRIQSFQHLVIHACGDSVLWTSNIGNVLASSSCPSVHTNGVWIRMAATNLTILRLALVPGISLLTSLFSSTCATPIYPYPAVSCVVSRRNKKALTADATKNEGRDEVHDRALVHQGHVSVSFLTLLR